MSFSPATGVSVDRCLPSCSQLRRVGEWHVFIDLLAAEEINAGLGDDLERGLRFDVGHGSPFSSRSVDDFPIGGLS